MYENIGRRFRERRMPPIGLFFLGLAAWLVVGLVGHLVYRLACLLF